MFKKILTCLALDNFCKANMYTVRCTVYIKVSTDHKLLKIDARGGFSHSNVYRENKSKFLAPYL